MVKLEKKINKTELGYLIQKNFRGKKFAEKMLTLFYPGGGVFTAPL